MQRLTIQEAIEASDIHNQDAGHYIYRYYDGDTTFYVGCSVHPFTRLRQHLGQEGGFYTHPDASGQLILNHQPDSLSWLMEVYSVDELLTDEERGQLHHNLILAERFELEMIAHYKPC